MLFLGGARQSGKTTELIRWLAQDEKRGLLTFSQQRKKQLQEQWPEVEKQIFAYDEKWQADNVAIDDVEFILQKMFKGKVEKVSFSGHVMLTHLQ